MEEGSVPEIQRARPVEKQAAQEKTSGELFNQITNHHTVQSKREVLEILLALLSYVENKHSKKERKIEQLLLTGKLPQLQEGAGKKKKGSWGEVFQFLTKMYAEKSAKNPTRAAYFQKQLKDLEQINLDVASRKTSQKNAIAKSDLMVKDSASVVEEDHFTALKAPIAPPDNLAANPKNKDVANSLKYLLALLKLLGLGKDAKTIENLINQIKEGKPLTPAELQTVLTIFSSAQTAALKLVGKDQGKYEAFLKDSYHFLEDLRKGNDAQRSAIEKQIEILEKIETVISVLNDIKNALKGGTFNASELNQFEAALSALKAQEGNLPPNLKAQVSQFLHNFNSADDGKLSEFFKALDKFLSSKPPPSQAQINQFMSKQIGSFGGVTIFLDLIEDASKALPSPGAINQFINNDKAQISFLDREHKAIINDINGVIAQAESLPDQFANTILGYYMPGQEAYLKLLASALEIANGGTEFFNSILNGMTGLSNARTQLNFAHWIQAHGDKWGKGDENSLKAQLSAYKEHLKNDLGESKAQLAKIEAKIKELEKQIDVNYSKKPLTASQKQQLAADEKMLQELNKVVPQLNTAITQLTQLNKIAQGMSVQPIYKKEKHGKEEVVGYKIDGFNGNAVKLENKLQTELPNIVQDIKTYQGYWSSQSTIKQIHLQLAMTEITQEWEVVSQSMRILYQDYLTLARGIKGQ